MEEPQQEQQQEQQQQQQQQQRRGGSSPSSSNRDQRGTRLWELLEAGDLQVVRGRYFVERLEEKGGRIQMCQDVAPTYVWDGREVVERWATLGAYFLVAVSYAWLDGEHPDPDGFHLQRLSTLVREHWAKYAPVGDIGIIFDYTCLPQRKVLEGGAAGADARTAEDRARVAACLEEIHTVFGHARIRSWRLEEVPSEVARKYDDRGWTLFESAIMSAKGNLCQSPNVLVLPAEAGEEVPCCPQRRPPLTPERFERELERRGEVARAKGVPLFARGKEDLAFVRRKYSDAFTQLALSDALYYDDASSWGAEEAEVLLEALPAFRRLRDLRVAGLRPEVGARLARGLAELLLGGHCPRLKSLGLQQAAPMAAAALRLAWAARHPSPDRCLEEGSGWCCCCWCFGRECVASVWLDSTSFG